ncbi:hypothetical protein KAFR_0G02175 [Kazachstania africana CBS 2517]|uniref:Mitochondrial outer membrane protein OM14 C-terminal domain-containing protein n=1 Tax=Kazachstania africana (strain ATCC 22294 / BCRC 22015 / CBS 2517 / CECT 1963 / NBRC 1671 / NRRL Y-8276) TaxID=1071382 RepID=H2AY01_KAZAF|nr:hypothetical protein KAFR_0G02175 [Kazachstania africana CBS 2517]CCF59251.1 hypothetical protein KAFR_0G02175 [Kazachstania africana CBS 2517]
MAYPFDDPIKQTTKIDQPLGTQSTTPNVSPPAPPPSDGTSKGYCARTHDFLSAGLHKCKTYVLSTKEYLSTKTCNFTKTLANPIVFLNFLFWSASLSSLFIYYIKYEKSFLQDRSNKFIWSSLAGLGTLLTFDTLVSKKYYDSTKKD